MSLTGKTRDVEYNPSGIAPAGATQLDTIAVATGNPNYQIGSWFGGVNESLGYVIVNDTNSTNLVGRGSGGGLGSPIQSDKPIFWLSDGLTDQALVDLANRLPGSPGNLADVDAVRTWVGTNNYSIVNDIDRANLVLSLDALSYNQNPNGFWVDSVNNRSFTLYNSPSYDGQYGGKIDFSAGAGQYAFCSNGLPTLNKWSVVVWHYFTGNSTPGGYECLVTENFPGTTYYINYSLGFNRGQGGGLSSGFFDGTMNGWRTTNGTSLTPGLWYQTVGTYDGDNIKLYVNGSLIFTTYYPVAQSSSNGGIILMKRWDNSEFWDGSLSIVKIYDNDITQSGVSNDFQTNRGRFGI